MQTFLPYTSFEESARCLDPKRCLKQTVESHQLINIIRNNLNGYKSHPATQMWRGYVPALIYYYNTFWCENLSRGVKWVKLQWEDIGISTIEMPAWLYDERLIISHRSNLLRKNPSYYSKYKWCIANNLPYWWPTKRGE